MTMSPSLYYWDHVYGRRVPFKIEKGSAPFELVHANHILTCVSLLIFYDYQANQKLSEYRNKLASKAIPAVLEYYCLSVDPEANVENDKEELAKFAKAILIGQKFVFKGAENIKHTSFNHFELYQLDSDVFWDSQSRLAGFFIRSFLRHLLLISPL